MTGIVVQKLVSAVAAYIEPIVIKEATALLTDCCPRHGEQCPTGRAHCKECGTRLFGGYCNHELCKKSYEGKQTTRM